MATRQKNPDPHSKMGFRLKHKKIRDASVRLLRKKNNHPMTSQELIDNITRLDGRTFSQRNVTASASGLTVTLKRDERFEPHGDDTPTIWKLSDYGLSYDIRAYQ